MQSRPRRAASKKRRQATVSTETENKLARAARSAQRLAQLSDASRDDSTLDLFPDDPTRATLEAMNIDIRQGTLHGFELPDVVLAAVGAIDTADNALADARTPRRAPRAARSDDLPVPVNALLSGLEIEPLVTAASAAGEVVAGGAKPDASAGDKPPAPARDAVPPPTPAMAAATVARSVTALRQAAEPGAATDTVTVPAAGDGRVPQRFAATFAKAASASGSVSGLASGSASDLDLDLDLASASASASQETVAVAASLADTTSEPGTAQSGGTTEGSKPGSEASTNSSASAPTSAAFATPSREARRAEAAAAALRAAPELDRARATAFADTVDALYGVIADQRRAATDHSRRMKWMLSIVVGALLVTVAIGITQTVLLMHLTRETTAQQHRVEQMMQNQQAAMASLLDTHIAMANAAAANAASDAAAAAVAPAAPQQTATAPAHVRRAARAQHAHRPKAATSH
jgi:hypothetical protein